MGTLEAVALFTGIIGTILGTIAVYASLIAPRLRKSKLKFDINSASFYGQSGDINEEFTRISLDIDIMNYGNAPTTIRKLRVVGADLSKEFEVKTVDPEGTVNYKLAFLTDYLYTLKKEKESEFELRIFDSRSQYDIRFKAKNEERV